MLTISNRALSVIRRVTDHRRLESGSGVRIARDHDTLQVHAVNHPAPGDRLVEQPGARLYVSPDAAERVDGAELDASTQPGDRVQFVLRR